MIEHKLPLVIRVDAFAEIGTGHLMRCLSLMQAWRKQGGATVFVSHCSAAIHARLKEEGCEVHPMERPGSNAREWENFKSVLARYPAAPVVLDGYYFDETYQRHIKDFGHWLLVVDDTAHLNYYVADAILNQNWGAELIPYACECGTHFLKGPQFALLREEFWSFSNFQRVHPKVARRVLVTLGGSDPANVTLEVMRALEQVEILGLEIKVVVGAANPHLSFLRESCHVFAHSIELLHNVKAMPELMAWADIAISAGGSTCWELAFMGLPNLILVLADNQLPVAQALQEGGVSVNLGPSQLSDVRTVARSVRELANNASQREQMSRNGRNLIDGRGTHRVAKFIESKSQ